jgi:hypothetical protein
VAEKEKNKEKKVFYEMNTLCKYKSKPLVNLGWADIGFFRD